MSGSLDVARAREPAPVVWAAVAGGASKDRARPSAQMQTRAVLSHAGAFAFPPSLTPVTLFAVALVCGVVIAISSIPLIT